MRTALHCILLGLLGAGLAARADLVIDWNNEALDAIRISRTPPPTASRQLAILHIAIYDAVNSIKAPHEQRYQPYLITKHGPGDASQQAAAAAAAHLVLTNFYPSLTARFNAAYNTALTPVPNGNKKIRGIMWGQMVGREIMAARAKDGSTNTVTYTPGTDPGEWRPHVSFGGIVRPALLPHWGNVMPFGIQSGSQFRPPLPPALHTIEYFIDFMITQLLGETNSTLRTLEQTEIALFWANGAGTATPPGHWNIIGQMAANAHRLALDDSARLFALLNIALADAAIVCWDCKYAYNYWRPIQAIPEAAADGNPLTQPDASWQPLLFTPPFPEYTSGHSTFSGAAAVVLARFFGSDEFPFMLESEEYPGIIRSFESFSQAAEESGASRIYGGIHFWSANVHGLESGAAIGDYVMDNLLPRKKLPKPPKTVRH